MPDYEKPQFRSVLQDLVRSGEQCTISLRYKVSNVSEQGASEGPMALNGVVKRVDTGDSVNRPALVTLEAGGMRQDKGSGAPPTPVIISVYFPEDAVFMVQVIRESVIQVPKLNLKGIPGLGSSGRG